MRKFFGWLLIVLGALVVLPGIAAAAFVGPNNTVEVTSGPVDTEAAAVTISPQLLSVTGPTIHVRAEGGPGVFVGAAHPVHVDAYLEDVPVERISEISMSGLGAEFSTSPRAGDEEAPAAEPTDLDWWTETATGGGEQTVSAELTEEPVSFVIMNADLSTPVNIDLTVDATVDRLFTTALLVVVIGVIMIGGGIFLLRSGRRPAETDGTTEEAAEVPATAEEAAESPATSDEDEAVSPPSEPLRRSAKIGVIAVGSLVIASCAQVPEQIERDDTYSLPAASTDQAEEFIAHYVDATNLANEDLDADVAATVMAGPRLSAARFRYKIDEVRDNDPSDPFFLDFSSAAIPSATEYPLWYVAVAEWADDPDGEASTEEADDADDAEAEDADEDADSEDGRSYYFVNRADPVSDWKAQLVVGLSADVEVPAFRLDGDGLAEAEAPSDDIVEDVFDQLGTFAETGDEGDLDVEHAERIGSIHEDVGFNPTNLTSEAGSIRLSCGLWQPDSVNWLATDSGWLAMTAVRCTQNFQLNRGYYLTVENGFGTIPADTEITNSTIEYQRAALVHVNESGDAAVYESNSGSLTSMEFTEQ
jgi:hypothetical protein